MFSDVRPRAITADERPTLWGGRFNADELEAFIAAWKLDERAMPHRLWEYVSALEFAPTLGAPGTLTAPEFLDRAEIFGAGGHLSLRRDGHEYLWHYIGTAVDPSPVQPPPDDYWKQHPSTTLHCYDESVLLWGQANANQAGVWQEDRVAGAKLSYPAQYWVIGKDDQGKPRGKRVLLDFRRYTEGGQTAFIWYRGLRSA